MTHAPLPHPLPAVFDSDEPFEWCMAGTRGIHATPTGRRIGRMIAAAAEGDRIAALIRDGDAPARYDRSAAGPRSRGWRRTAGRYMRHWATATSKPCASSSKQVPTQTPWWSPVAGTHPVTSPGGEWIGGGGRNLSRFRRRSERDRLLAPGHTPGRRGAGGSTGDGRVPFGSRRRSQSARGALGHAPGVGDHKRTP